MFLRNDEDTVCALSTAPGLGGIAVIRISGSQSALVTRGLCAFLPLKPESHRVYYGHLVDPQTKEELDEVLLTYFAHGRSFTGEETIEISCHGGTTVSSRILDALIKSGARLAERGEFTYRSFMNGKIDLVQAESILQLIESQSNRAAKLAYRQLRGDFSTQLKWIEDHLIWVLANLEANIDFAAEDIEVAAENILLERLSVALSSVDKLLETYSKGRLIRDGLEVALVGEPNVGKSSLLNYILEEDRAIVTEIPGTTRDFVEGRLSVGGHAVSFIDTAGLRETTDVVEKHGIEKTNEILNRADLVFYVFDSSQPFSRDCLNVLTPEVLKKTVLILNKIDVAAGEFLQPGFIQNLMQTSCIQTSALKKMGRAEMLAKVESILADQLFEDSTVVMNARHFELLEKMRGSLDRSRSQFKENASPEFIAFELQDALHAIHEILGKKFDDQVMDRVFKEFCLGK